MKRRKSVSLEVAAAHTHTTLVWLYSVMLKSSNNKLGVHINSTQRHARVHLSYHDRDSAVASNNEFCQCDCVYYCHFYILNCLIYIINDRIKWFSFGAHFFFCCVVLSLIYSVYLLNIHWPCSHLFSHLHTLSHRYIHSFYLSPLPDAHSLIHWNTHTLGMDLQSASSVLRTHTL